MLIPLILATLVALIVIGISCAVFGMRGKRLNEHPICRACAFDLENIYPARSTCPECGADLERAAAVQIGQRRRRSAFVVAGLLLIIIPLAPIIGLTWAAAAGKNLNNFKPFSLLLWEARQDDTKDAKAIATELMDRMIAGTLGKSQEERVAQLALARQENLNTPWNDTWGDLFERARFNGNATKEDQQQFLRNAAIPRLLARPKVAAGANIPVAVETELRIGSTTQAIINVWLDKAMLDQVVVNRVSGSGGSNFPVAALAGDSGAISTIMAIGPRTAGAGAIMGAGPAVFEISAGGAPIGGHELEAQVLVTATPWDSTGKGIMDAMTKPKPTSKKVRAWTIKTPVELVLPEQAAITQIAATPALDARLRTKLTPTYIMLLPTPFGNKPSLNINFSVAGLPVPVAFEVFAADGDKIVKVGEFTSGMAPLSRSLYSMSMQTDFRTVSGPSFGSKVKTIDIVLKPKIELAAKTTDLTQIYGGVIEFKNVAVNTQPYEQVMPAVQAQAAPLQAEADEVAAKEPPPKKKPVRWTLRGLVPW